MPRVFFEDATRSTNVSIYPYVIDLEILDEKRERKDTKIIFVENLSARCRFRIYSHKIIFLSDNINYILWFVPILPRSFFFPFIIVNIYTLLPISPSLALSLRAITRLHQFDTQTIDIVCHEIRRPTRVLKLHFDDEERIKGRSIWSAILLVRRWLYTDS